MHALAPIFISAFIHPIWNMYVKENENKIVFYFNVHIFYVIFFSFIPAIFPLNHVTYLGWFLAIASGIVHFFYQIYLCKSYDLGDLSIAYPIIRSAPIFVAILGVIFLKERLSTLALTGIILTVMGAQLINQDKLSFSKLLIFKKVINKKMLVAAVITAVLSALYSVIDKRGVSEVEPALFFYILFSVSGILFTYYILIHHKDKCGYWQLTWKYRYKIIVVAFLEFLSYLLILYAFKSATAAYVVAVRQISVVFGALLGIVFLKEKYARIRVLASIVIFIGIYLVVISNH